MRFDEFALFVDTLTQATDQVICPAFREPIAVEHKGDGTPVTVVDQGAETVLRQRIEAAYPGHGILGEEWGGTNEGATWTWILDPIDGTVSFANGCPLFGTLIGLVKDGKPYMGAIHLPILGLTYLGDGSQATCNGKRINMRDCGALEDALCLATDVMDIVKHHGRQGFDALVKRVYRFRTWGDCYGYTLLAMGRADIMLDPTLKAWDILPIVPVIQGAGGMVTSWSGGDPVGAKDLVVAGRRLHPQVLGVLHEKQAAGGGQ